MSRFISAFLLFSIIAGTLFMVLLLSLNHFVINTQNSYQISPTVNTIFLGHSHSECSYNDNIIPHSINLSSSGEAYFYTYLKFKSILKHNSHIERVFIEFSNNQISDGMDDWTWDLSHISRSFPSLSPICSIEDHLMLSSNNPRAYLKGLQKAFSFNVKRITLHSHYYDINNSGGFKALDAVFETKQDTTVDIIDYSKLSLVNLHYLEKTIRLAKKNAIEVNLIRSPTWKSYRYLKNEAYFQNIRLEKFPSINFIDLGSFFKDSKYFRDSGHLNATGASEISEYFTYHLN